MRKKRKVTQIDSLDKIPRFRSEDEERKFWEVHGLSENLMDELYDSVLERKEHELTKKIRLTDRRKSK